MASLNSAALIRENSIDYIGIRELIYRIARGIISKSNRATSPIRHTPKDRSHIINDCVGFFPALEIDIASISRLCTAKAIRHKLIAIATNSIQSPFIDLCFWDKSAQSISAISYQIIETPCRVISPSYLKSTIPYPRISSSLWVIV